MIAYLVELGANLEQKDDDANTALLMASASLLLEALDHGGYIQQPPFDGAAQEGGRGEDSGGAGRRRPRGEGRRRRSC